MKLAYIILYTHNVKKTLDFYEKVFGLTTKFLNDTGHYGELDAEGAVTIGVVSYEDVHKMGLDFVEKSKSLFPFNLSFEVKDVDKAFAHALDHGAISVLPPKDSSWGERIAFIKDHNGVTVALGSGVN
jgi:uncharacterized glyoxalase superfamily protein PhnB